MNSQNSNKIALLLTCFAFLALTEGIPGKTLTGCDSDWQQYRDSKCFKLLRANETGAENISSICRRESGVPYSANLVTINSEDEQIHLANLVGNNVSSTYIGLFRINGTFVWSNGSRPTFTNWAPGSPRNNQSGTDCVAMMSASPGVAAGKWRDVACDSSTNYVICEKIQVWTLYEAQLALMNLRDKLDDSSRDVEKLKVATNRLEEENSKLEEKTSKLEVENLKLENKTSNLEEKTSKLEEENQILKENPVPVGFVYVQLRDEPSPSVTWPNVTWTDISSSYAGLFFRVAGGNSSSFGSNQSHNSRRLTHIQSLKRYDVDSTIVTVTPGQWTPSIYTGSGSVTNWGLKFLVSDDEPRPYNTAMRIWKRTK